MDIKKDSSLLDLKSDEQKDVQKIILEAYQTLINKGYNPYDQFSGYLVSGDPGYIPQDNDARNLIRKYDRNIIIEEIFNFYINNHSKEM
ncbi:IreB family regulatory phosphoprotein [Lactobacillus sp. S2-2]|uniref:IreB family regulatory phosphoprotein n=1 Tax=Lactobacillus sp. S2-2 TaxID=2692917 RepID=UPI001F40905B|nr:IreB family regulatory phosphoprotein [Lactobacillus sp. S2-2]MCF6515812.1 IreB family regulatory phosphoprotein [Lactobacillus sp. S2-2]